MNKIRPNVVRQVFILLIILLIGILIFKEMFPYLSGILGAITMYVILRKWTVKLIDKGWSSSMASLALLVISFVGILMPIIALIFLLSNKIGSVANNSQKFLRALKEQLNTWEAQLGFDIHSKIDIENVSNWIVENLQNLVGETFNIFISIGIMYFLLYYMLTNSEKLRESLFEYIPINKENLTLIEDQSQKMVRSNAIGIPLVAIIQGVVGLIGFLIFNISDPFFWFAIVIIGSMIPFVGTLIAIIPVYIITLSEGQTIEAWGILIYGLTIVAASDNLVRLFVLKRLDNVHPVITLIGVIVGIPLFGFIGLVFGPLLINLFLIVIKIYKLEYSKTDNRGKKIL